MAAGRSEEQQCRSPRAPRLCPPRRSAHPAALPQVFGASAGHRRGRAAPPPLLPGPLPRRQGQEGLGGGRACRRRGGRGAHVPTAAALRLWVLQHHCNLELGPSHGSLSMPLPRRSEWRRRTCGRSGCAWRRCRRATPRPPPSSSATCTKLSRPWEAAGGLGKELSDLDGHAVGGAACALAKDHATHAPPLAPVARCCSEKHAVQGLTLAIERGECFGLLVSVVVCSTCAGRSRCSRRTRRPTLAARSSLCAGPQRRGQVHNSEHFDRIPGAHQGCAPQQCIPDPALQQQAQRACHRTYCPCAPPPHGAPPPCSRACAAPHPTQARRWWRGTTSRATCPPSTA